MLKKHLWSAPEMLNTQAPCDNQVANCINLMSKTNWSKYFKSET